MLLGSIICIIRSGCILTCSCIQEIESVLAVYRWTGHDAQIYSLGVEPRLYLKTTRYRVDDTCYLVG